MKKLTTYLLSTGLIAAAAMSMSAIAYADGEATTDATADYGVKLSVKVVPADGAKDAAAVDKFETIDAALKAMSKAKTTGAVTMTLLSGKGDAKVSDSSTANNAYTTGDKVDIPKSLTSLTIQADPDAEENFEGFVIDASAAKSIAANCALILKDDISLVGGESTKFTAKGNLTLDGGSMSTFASLKGARTGTLTLKGTNDINFQIAGFGKVDVPADSTAKFTGVAKGDNLKVTELAVGGTIEVYSSPLTVDTLSGSGTIDYRTTVTKESSDATESTTAAHSYINVKKSFKGSSLTLDNNVVNIIASEAAAPVETEFDTEKIFVIKAKDYDTAKVGTYFKLADGIKTVHTAADDDEEVEYGISSIKGVVAVKPRAFSVNEGDGLTEWADVISSIKSASTPYTVEILADADIGKMTMPKKGTYKSLTIDGNNNTLSFTGGISAETLTLKDIELKSYKYDKKNNVKNGVAFALAGKTALTLDGVTLEDGTYTTADDGTKTYTETATTLKSVSAGTLTITADTAVEATGKITATNLVAPEEGTATLGASSFAFKGAVTGGEGTVDIKILDKKGDPGDLTKAKIAVGTYGNQFALKSYNDEEKAWVNGGNKLVFSGKNLVVVSEDTLAPIVTDGTVLVAFKDIKSAVAYINNAKNAKAEYTIALTESSYDKLTLPKAGTFKSLTLASIYSETSDTETTIGSTLNAAKIKSIPYNITLDNSIFVSGSLSAKTKGKFSGGVVEHSYSIEIASTGAVTLKDGSTTISTISFEEIAEGGATITNGKITDTPEIAEGETTATADKKIKVKNTADNSTAEATITITATKAEGAAATTYTYAVKGDVTTTQGTTSAWEFTPATSGDEGGGSETPAAKTYTLTLGSNIWSGLVGATSGIYVTVDSLKDGETDIEWGESNMTITSSDSSIATGEYNLKTDNITKRVKITPKAAGTAELTVTISDANGSGTAKIAVTVTSDD